MTSSGSASGCTAPTGTDTRLDLASGDGAHTASGPANALVDVALGRTGENRAPGELGLLTVEALDAAYRSAGRRRCGYRARIVRIEAWQVEYTEPNGHNGRRCITLVRLTADDGTTGWGEAVTLFREAALATAVTVDGMAGVVVGADARRPVMLWRAVKAHTWWYGKGSVATFALSAIDMATWDLAGRLRGIPVVDLLGGAVHESLPVCVTSHATLPDLGCRGRAVRRLDRRATGDRLQGRLRQAGRGQLGFDHDRDIAFVRLLRAAVGDAPPPSPT